MKSLYLCLKTTYCLKVIYVYNSAMKMLRTITSYDTRSVLDWKLQINNKFSVINIISSPYSTGVLNSILSLTCFVFRQELCYKLIVLKYWKRFADGTGVVMKVYFLFAQNCYIKGTVIYLFLIHEKTWKVYSSSNNKTKQAMTLGSGWRRVGDATQGD